MDNYFNFIGEYGLCKYEKGYSNHRSDVEELIKSVWRS